MINNNFENVFLKSYKNDNHDTIYKRWFSQKYVQNVKGWRRIFYHKLTYSEIVKKVSKLQKQIREELPKDKNEWNIRNKRFENLKNSFQIVHNHRLKKTTVETSTAVLNLFPDLSKTDSFISDVNEYLEGRKSLDLILTFLYDTKDFFHYQTLGEYLRDQVTYKKTIQNGLETETIIETEKVDRAKALISKISRNDDFTNFFCDFRLKTKDSNLYANKALLQAQCDFILEEFPQNESDLTQTSGKGLNSDYVKDFFKYIHHGKFDILDWKDVRLYLDKTSPFNYFNLIDKTVVFKYIDQAIKDLFKPDEKFSKIGKEIRIKRAADGISVLWDYAVELEKQEKALALKHPEQPKLHNANRVFMLCLAMMSSFGGEDTSFVEKSNFTKYLKNNLKEIPHQTLQLMSNKMTELMEEAWWSGGIVFDFNIYQGKLVASINKIIIWMQRKNLLINIK